MKSSDSLRRALETGAYDTALALLYANNLQSARTRALGVVESFACNFPNNTGKPALFSSPGRTELGGNHTDHQRGHVLCASVTLDMLACAAENGEQVIRIVSRGYPALEIDLRQLSPVQGEENTSAALVRGVAARIAQLGYAVAGFDAYISSDVLSGAGLSSSAAYEVLVGNIINYFFCRQTLSPMELAQIGQYAENVYFGKPSGLMDQMGCAVGGAIAIDFCDPEQPQMKKIPYDFTHSGHALCIVDTGSCHADLTQDYAEITSEMACVAAFFGKSALREVPQSEFYREIPALRVRCGDRAVLRAMHFYEENQTAIFEARALEGGDFQRFLSLVHISGLSSALHLQNTWSPSTPQQQAIPLALAVGRDLLAGTGAIRVHGGGFAGTVQAFVPNPRLDEFKVGMTRLFGADCCHVAHIRAQGGCVIEP